eukprot:Rhum_TRINITY_DN12102_c0_g1::Rhum_TRINITY_DN12102_c0_g1_i1::g.49304::m.49304
MVPHGVQLVLRRVVDLARCDLAADRHAPLVLHLDLDVRLEASAAANGGKVGAAQQPHAERGLVCVVQRLQGEGHLVARHRQLLRIAVEDDAELEGAQRLLRAQRLVALLLEQRRVLLLHARPHRQRQLQPRLAAVLQVARRQLLRRVAERVVVQRVLVPHGELQHRQYAGRQVDRPLLRLLPRRVQCIRQRLRFVLLLAPAVPGQSHHEEGVRRPHVLLDQRLSVQRCKLQVRRHIRRRRRGCACRRRTRPCCRRRSHRRSRARLGVAFVDEGEAQRPEGAFCLQLCVALVPGPPHERNALLRPRQRRGRKPFAPLLREDALRAALRRQRHLAVAQEVLAHRVVVPHRELHEKALLPRVRDAPRLPLLLLLPRRLVVVRQRLRRLRHAGDRHLAERVRLAEGVAVDQARRADVHQLQGPHRASCEPLFWLLRHWHRRQHGKEALRVWGTKGGKVGWPNEVQIL